MRTTMRRRAVGLVLAAVLAPPAAPAGAGNSAGDGRCGNGVIDPGEACDDGNRFAGDCCSPDCRLEESHLGCAGECLCATCDDGIDNDGDGLADAEDPECATLADLQRYAWVDAGVLTAAERTDAAAVVAVPAVSAGALAGRAVAGMCDSAAAACVCPEVAPDCQPAGRPCRQDADCEPAPYPAGESRAWVCDAAAVAAGACGPAVARIRSAIDGIWSLPGEPVTVTPATAAMPGEIRLAAGTQIIDVENIVVAAGAEMVLVGEADTTVILRVGTSLALGRRAALRVGGDLAADRVLWVVGAGSAFRIGDEAHFVGTLLADDRAELKIGVGARWEGAAFGAARPPS